LKGVNEKRQTFPGLPAGVLWIFQLSMTPPDDDADADKCYQA